MKQFRLLPTLLALLAVGSMNTWAETETETITLTYSSFGLTSSYAEKTATINNFGFIVNQGYKGTAGGGCIQMNSKKGSGILYNTTPISGLKSVTVNVASGTKTYTITTGTTSQPTTEAGTGTTTSTINVKNSGDTYFQLKVSGASYFSSIVITYETSTSSCTKPTFTIEDKTITLEEADLFDLSALTTNKGGSTGAVTYSCSDETNVIIDGSTFYTETPGTYTITATMAADGTYCEAITTFKITVQAAPCTTLNVPTGLSASVTAYNSAILSWNTVDNAAKYQITTTPPAFGGSATYTTTGTETTYTATDLSPETEYKWTVKALGNGTTYCDSKESADGTFTTPAKPKYTIIWSTPTGTDTTQVTEGSAIGTLPAAPTSCSTTYTNFVGWFTGAAGSESNPSTAKPATQVTAATIPTGDATYYAVFSDGTESETTLNIPNNTLIGSLTASYSDKSFSVNGYSFNLNACKQNDYCQMRDNNTISYIEIPTLPGRITKISTSDCKNASGSAYKGTLHLKTTKTRGNSDKDDIAEVTYSSVSSFSWDLSTTNATSGFLVTSEGLRLKDLSITYLATTPATGYISFCTPCIKGTDDITVTSAQGIWVEAVTPLNITATNLDKNADGAKVTITATSLTDGFTLKTQGTDGSGSESVTLETDYSNSIYNANLMVVYSPTADNIIEEGKIALRVCNTNGTSTYATDTIIVRGRSLPAEFVLAAETTNGWVALPADLGTSSTDAVKEPYTISVDDNAAPTKATLAPQSALYSAAMRSTVNAIPTGLRFKAGERYLQGSQSEGETKVWLSSNNKQMQSWELHSSNLTDYFVRLRAAEAGRYLSYNATQGKIANYKQDSCLRILPVENTCVRFDAPKLVVHTLTSTSATLRWEEIAGVNEYEYSLDNGASWQTCTGVQTMGTAIQWTLGGLETQKQYTIWVRAKVANGETNCSDDDTETFTTTNCDDVPIDLWSSATANSVTITWKAQAATATVKIYSDEEGKNEVKSVQNLSSPAKIMGLAPNTKYYFQVLADGSCASAIDNFLTESNEVSIVEWKKDAVIVDLNTEVTDADEVSILVEGQKTHGTNNNVADDLFFSKYYEATGNVKLVAIFNGTKDTLSLANIKIHIGQEAGKSSTNTQWDRSISLQSQGKFKEGFIAPNEEIILWCKGSSNVDKSIISCVDGKMDVNIMKEEAQVVFGGRQTIALSRNGEIIDIMGAVSTNDADITKSFPMKGNCRPTWGDMKSDEFTWCGTGYSIEDKTTEIELSMNRCLLVRNKVKSGANAVANNVGAFNTFTKDEWLGRPVEEGSDNGITESCNGFAYVADFNYNDYYTTYDSITNLEIKGNRNEDGTYTIPIPKLDTMACTNLRLQLKKKGTIQATREEKVPIIIYKTTDTKNSEFFGEKLTDEVCATCDVVVRDNAQLSHIAGGKQQFRDMYVYTGSSLNIPENQTMSLDKVRMFATNDNVSYAVINNSNDAAAAISVKEVSHVKRIDGRYWYPFSLPYDCNIADIDQLNGQPLGVYGTDWGIKYYDGQRRQSEGNSTTHYGEVSKYWTMMPEDGQLKAYTGYIIGLFVPAADEPLMKSVNFPPATESAYTENASSKTTHITNWSVNLTAKPRHHGWNFVGSPYISLFGSNNLGDGLNSTWVQMGWTDALGNQRDKDLIYVSIPDGGNSNTYTQALASGVTIYPFSAYFVQAIDPTNGQSNTLNLTYSKGPRSLPKWAPARTAKTDALILTELDITNGALGDNTGVLVSNVYSAEYEIGDDLTKMYAAAQKPQLYTIDVHNDKMAYQALPDVLAHAIPLGIYVPQAGDYTLSLNRYVSRLEAAEAVYLLHNGAVVANLLLSDYIVSASAKGTISGYSLDIRRAPEVVTDIVPAAGDAPYIIARDGVLAIANLPADAVVQVYDVLGHQLLRADTPATATLQVPVLQTGVYTVVITTADGQQVLKTLLR